MKINKEEFYITFTPKPSTKFNAFLELFLIDAKKNDSKNIILNLLYYKISINELLQLVDFSINKMELGTSFVVIKTEIDLDIIPDELIIVPTLQEAIDIIDMDEMTRSLDF